TRRELVVDVERVEVGYIVRRTMRVEHIFFFQAEDGIRDRNVTGVQTCALPIGRLVRTSLSGSRRVEETLDRIRVYVAEHFPADIAVNLTGTLVLLTGTASDIVAGQIKSLTLALGIIFLVMTAMFLSAKIGFFAILPNVVPI